MLGPNRLLGYVEQEMALGRLSVHTNIVLFLIYFIVNFIIKLACVVNTTELARPTYVCDFRGPM